MASPRLCSNMLILNGWTSVDNIWCRKRIPIFACDTLIQSGGKAVVRAVNKKSIHGDIVWAGASEGAMINSSEFQKYVFLSKSS